MIHALDSDFAKEVALLLASIENEKTANAESLKENTSN